MLNHEKMWNTLSEVMMYDKNDFSSRDEYRIWNVIKEHRGQDDAINQHSIFKKAFPYLLETLSGQEIASAKIVMRKAIRALRNNGFPILSKPGMSGGYYLPVSSFEVQNWRDYMRAKAFSALGIVNPVIRGCNKLLRENVRQLELNF